MKTIYMENGIIMYYGSRVGQIADGCAVVDPLFQGPELQDFLDKQKHIREVKWMDGIYDRLDFPEVSRKMRRLHLYRERLQESLTGEAAASEEPDATEAWGRALALRRNRNPWLYPDPVKGKTALCVCTQYRQHNSWQGYIYGENQQKVFFRSALELLYLLDDFLREQTEQISGKVGKTGRMGE